MTTKMKKFFDFDVKAVEGEENTFWFTASTQARDRQGDVIVQSGWKTADFMKNPVILWAHNYAEPPIGKAIEISLTQNALSAKIQFVPESIDPFAGKVAKLVAGGYLKTVSVGFMVWKSEDLTTDDLKARPDMKYGQRLYGDLLEISIVPVPANPEALNENGYTELVARAYGFKPSEIKSALLPTTDTKGLFDAKMLRASVAALRGARGGIKLRGENPEACMNYLKRVARENGVALPDESVDLKEGFSDVWHDELLDVLNKAAECQNDVLVKLVKGHTRSQMVAARDALNAILDLHEEQAKEVEADASAGALAAVESITKNLSEITSRLS